MREKILRRIHDLYSLDAETISRDFDPALNWYYKKLRGNAREIDGFIRWCGALTSLLDSKGGVVLDAGCGFGITCFTFVATPDAPSTVVGLDPSKNMIDVMSKVADFLGVGEDIVKPVQGDAMALEFSDGEFDGVFVKDVASHVKDRDTFWSELSRVIKPGGKLVLTDENNALSYPGRSAREKIWEQAEYGPLPEGSWLERPFRAERKLIISEIRQDLSDSEQEKLADLSIGMWGEALRAAIKGYSPGGVFVNTSDFPYRNPRSGDYTEYPFNPFELADELVKYRLKARVVRPLYQTGNPLKRLAGNLISLTHPLSIILQPSFYIVAEKM